MSRIRRHWLPWLVVVVELVGSLGSNAQTDTRGPAVLAALLAVVAVVPVVLKRPPAWTLALSALCVAGYFVAGYAEGPIFMALPVVTFAVALTQPTRRWLAWAVGGAALVAIAILLRPATTHLDSGPGVGPWSSGGGPPGDISMWQAFGQVALIAACGAVASALRSRNEARTQRQRRVVSEERVLMAADLHDGVGHGLAVIAMQAGAALHVLDRDPAAARRNLEAIRAESKESLDLLRNQLARMTEAPSAPRAPEHGLSDIPALVDRVRTGGLEISLRMDTDTVPAEAERAAYAVVQEGLTNVLRHAAASRAEVVISIPGGRSSMVVTVSDDGRGTGEPAGASGTSGKESAPGTGISGMRSRIEALGGTLDAGPEVRGFRLRASIPLVGSSAGSAEGLVRP